MQAQEGRRLPGLGQPGYSCRRRRSLGEDQLGRRRRRANSSSVELGYSCISTKASRPRAGWERLLPQPRGHALGAEWPWPGRPLSPCSCLRVERSSMSSCSCLRVVGQAASRPMFHWSSSAVTQSPHAQYYEGLVLASESLRVCVGGGLAGPLGKLGLHCLGNGKLSS